VIASWPEVRSEHWVRLLQARAIENLAFVVGVNRCGADPKLTYDGRSVGFDPHGNCLFKADGTEQVVIAEIDVEQARQWRAKFPALKDIRGPMRETPNPHFSPVTTTNQTNHTNRWIDLAHFEAGNKAPPENLWVDRGVFKAFRAKRMCAKRPK